MTTMTRPLPSESLPIGWLSCDSASAPGKVIYAEFSNPGAPIADGNLSVDELVAAIKSKRPQVASKLDSARKLLAEKLYADEPDVFSALRLKSGLSQAELARRAHTQQPYIARIEAGATDPGTDSIANLATALGVAPETVFSAIRRQRVTRGVAD